MLKTAILAGFLLAFGLSELQAQSFAFYNVLQAGRANAADWHIGVGSTSLAQLNTAPFAYDNSPPLHWNDGGSQNFEIGWNATTQTAYTTVFNQSNVATTVSLQATGTPLGANTVWTLPTSGFFASATPNSGNSAPSSISLTGLNFSPGVVILNGGVLPTTFGASQNGVASQTNLGGPILLQASSSGGSWLIQGSVQFTGLLTQGGQARANQLQFQLGASGSDTPEPASYALLGSGLILAAIIRKTRRNGTMK